MGAEDPKPRVEHTLNHNVEPLDPSRCPGCAADQIAGIEAQVVMEEASRAHCNPDGSMTRELAIVYLQHLMLEHLRAQVPGFEALAADESAPAVDRKDAALCAEVAGELARALELTNTAVLAAQAAVQVAPAAALRAIPVPGSRLPGSAR